MAGHGAPEHTKLWAMVETPYAMLHAEEIAAASDRLAVLVMGTNDLAKELYAEHVPGRQPLLTGLGLAVLAARATGKAIIDGVYNDVKDLDGFAAECRQGREMGFDGKTLIHPGQVEGANEAFAPSEQAIEDARGILQAWEDGRGLGRRHLQRPDGREPARRVGAAHAEHPRGDPGAARLSMTPRCSGTGPHYPDSGREDSMVILGVILAIIGLVADIPVLLTIGIILAIVGLILNLVPIGGTRRTYY